MTTTSKIGPLALALLLAACGGDAGSDAGADGRLTGAIEIDGSSTVYPITEAVAEEFMGAQPDVRVTVGVSGTGGGFSRFCAGETAISNASRPIKDSERGQCEAAGVDPIELEIAYDGLSIVANPQNTFAACLTTAELRSIWQPGSTVRSWADVRAGFPDQEIKLYGPGTDSGTFDYFTDVINGEEDASRSDYTASEDDNVLVQGVQGDAGALGYMGYAYYAENQQSMKLLGVDSGSGCVQPTPETIRDGSYAPLSRPVFIYVARAALERPEVRAFVDFYLEHAGELSQSVGYVPLEAADYQADRDALDAPAGAGGDAQTDTGAAAR
jgi:phosphate transport system substrate-binding protein